MDNNERIIAFLRASEDQLKLIDEILEGGEHTLGQGECGDKANHTERGRTEARHQQDYRMEAH